MIGNVLKIIYVRFGASRTTCGEIKIGVVDSTPPRPLASQNYPALSRVNKNNEQTGRFRPNLYFFL